MPNRIIKESIRTSKSINELNDFQFRLWLYLITYVDDYGCGSAEPDIVKGFVFPRRRSVTEKSIKDGLNELACRGLINLYEVDGESYFCFPNWSDHQRVRNQQRKFPEPPKGITNDSSQHFAADCGELRRVAADCGELPPESESEYESNINTSYSCTEQQAAPAPDEAQNAARDAGEPADVEPVRLNDGTYWQCSAADYAEYVRLFPAVDVAQEFCKMRAWAEANPRKCKTRGGIKRFVASWLSREQDKGHAASANVRAISSAPKSGQNRFINFKQDESVDYDAIARRKIAERSMG